MAQMDNSLIVTSTETDRWPAEAGGFAACLAVALAIDTLAAAWHCAMPDAITGDVAMYLQCGQLVLSGQIPFLDLVDVNPPLIMFLNVFPALMARLCGMPLELAGALFMGIVSLAATLLTALILKEFLCENYKRFFGPILLTGAVINALVTYDYGQREHFFAIVWLPFFFLRWSRYENPNAISGKFGNTLAALCGAAFGLGFALKLYFAVIPLACEFYWLVAAKKTKAEKLALLFSAEILSCTFVLLLYGLYFSLMPAAAHQVFFNEVMPLLVSAYSAFNASGFSMANVYWWPVLAFVIASLLVAAWCRPPRALAIPVIISLVAGFALVEFQHKGWTYHGISMLLSALLLFYLSLWPKIDKVKMRFWITTISSVLVALAACLWMTSVHQKLEALTSWQNRIGNYAINGQSVLYLDTSDCPWYVYSANAGLMPGSRYLWLFNLPMCEYKRAHIASDAALKPDEKARRLAGVEADVQAIVDNLVADAKQRQPVVVLCRTGNCYSMKPDFDLLAYLRKYGFERALSAYEEKERINDFVVFKRKSAN